MLTFIIFLVQIAEIVLWLRIVHTLKHSSIFGSRKDEKLWVVAIFLSLFCFDSIPAPAFFIFGSGMVVVFYAFLLGLLGSLPPFSKSLAASQE